jgi:toxin ParE1/3/4
MTLLKRPAFFRDVDRCAAYIARDNPDAARRLMASAESTCEALASQPGMGHEEGFCKRAAIRSWRVEGFENYLIFYRINPDSVEILRLLHAARDLPRFFKPK